MSRYCHFIEESAASSSCRFFILSRARSPFLIHLHLLIIFHDSFDSFFCFVVQMDEASEVLGVHTSCSHRAYVHFSSRDLCRLFLLSSSSCSSAVQIWINDQLVMSFSSGLVVHIKRALRWCHAPWWLWNKHTQSFQNEQKREYNHDYTICFYKQTIRYLSEMNDPITPRTHE